MLQKIREKITGWVAGVVLALLAFVFAVWGIDIGFSSRNTAAVVNGDEIPIGPVRQSIQLQVSRLAQQIGADVPEVLEDQIRRDVIEDFVRQRLLLQRVREEGYRIGDDELRREIREMPVFQVGGQFSMESYRALLANYGQSPAGFEAEQRQIMEIGQLQDGILRSAFATTDELERQVRLDREQRELEWVRLPVSNYAGDVTVDEAQILATYEATPDAYQSPETVDVEYLEIDLESIAAGVEVTDEEARLTYEEQVAREPDLFRAPETRRARHILVAIDDDTDEAEAEARAQELLERVQGGEDFAAVAQEASDDTGSAPLGGDLDWVEPGVMVAPFEEALFSMEDGEIRGPVRTPFGFHVILLEETREGETRTFEEARAQIEEDLRRTKAEDTYYERAETLERFAFDNPDTLVPAADELGLEIQRLSGVRRTGNTGLAANPEFVSTAFSLEVLEDGENSAALELEEGRAVVLRVAEHYPAELLPLAEVRDRIRAQLEREAARALAEQAASDLRQQLADGSSADEVAVAFDGDHEAARLVGRQDTEVPRPVRDAAFAAAAPQGVPVVDIVPLADGSQIVFRLTRVEPGDSESVPVAERRQLREQLIRRSGGEEITAYLAQLREDASVVVSTEQFE
jgi:peptidyl-prolyl cis-trans isomerase D